MRKGQSFECSLSIFYLFTLSLTPIVISNVDLSVHKLAHTGSTVLLIRENVTGKYKPTQTDLAVQLLVYYTCQESAKKVARVAFVPVCIFHIKLFIE